MNLTRSAVVAGLALLGLVGARAQSTQMDVSEIRPGMTGVGRTVFQGTRVEEFKVHVIGVIGNVIGTRRNLILARLEGGPLAETGVIAGMSGSPVYIDNRLVGAVSYALGSFSKEPIAGITPIAEMIDATARTARAPGTRVMVDFPLSRDGLLTSFRKALNANRPFADRADDAQLIGVSSLPGLGGREVATMLRPIATPLAMSGFEPDVARFLGDTFQEFGFVPMASAPGVGPGEMPFEGPLKPGDAVGVTFVSGDLQFGATGTVTHTDNDRVYAFGHPMYNLGPISFPMTRAYVYTVLPSLFSSSKLSSTNEVIGTFAQDRATAIAGRLGAGPSLLPVTMTLEGDRGTASRSFKFDVVRDQLFTPLMTYTALVSTLGSYERQFGTSTYSLEGSVRVKNYEPVTFRNQFAGDSASSNASAYVVAPLTALINNDYEDVDIESVNLTVKSAEEPQTAIIERAWLDDPRPRPGRTVPLKVLLRTYRGEDLLRTIPVSIPANANGSLVIVVSDGQRLAQSEQREVRSARPRSVAQLVRDLNKSRRNSTLYVKLLASDNGAVINGETLSSLPPSVLAVLEADHSGGSFNPLSSATIGEWELPTDHVLNGVRTLTIQVSGS